MPTLTLDRRSLHFLDVGQGIPLLLFHGFPFSSEVFWTLSEGAGLEGFRLLAPDLPGFGKSSPKEDLVSLDDYARDGLALLDHLGLPRACVGGLSMGGYVALALARLAPSRVQALALLSTQAGADDAAQQERREVQAQQVEREGVSLLAEQMAQRLFLPGTPEFVCKRVRSIMAAASPKGTAAALRAMAKRADSFATLKMFSGPAMVVVGSDDAITPPAMARAIATAAPQSQLVEVPNAGHLVHLEQPEAVRGALAAWRPTVANP